MATDADDVTEETALTAGEVTEEGAYERKVSFDDLSRKHEIELTGKATAAPTKAKRIVRLENMALDSSTKRVESKSGD